MRNFEVKLILRKIALMLALFFTILTQTGADIGLQNASAQAAGIPFVSESPGQGVIFENAFDDLSVLFINVGKADAILLQFAEKSFLIDTGEKASVPSLFGALNLYGIHHLDGVFLTHTHSDHMGGMEALAANYSIRALYSAVFSQNKKNGENKIDELAKGLSLTHQKLQVGEKVGVTESVFFEVLGPVVFNADDDNDNSLVLRLRVFGRTLLFMGDMQFLGEDTLLRSGADIDADVLKVGNHGNPDATSEQFAAEVSPAYAVISTNTLEDQDSANDRVLTALGGAEVFITENYASGILLTIKADGTIRVSNPELPKAPGNVVITGINKNMQTVTIRNMGPYADISGYVILSQRGSEVFVFPEGSQLESGQSVSISSQPGADYIWPDESKVWHQEKEDIAFLFDRFGNFLSRGD